MAGQNPLMFQVGIERANKEYDKIKKEIEDLVKLGDSGITIKVKLEELGNLQDFIKALQLIGDDQGLKKLIQNVTILKSQLQDVEEQSKKAHKAMAETSKSNQDEKTKLKNADELEARLRRLQDAYSTLNQLRHTALSNSLPVGDIETRMRKILEFIQKVRELQRGDLSNKNLLSTATFDDKLIFGKVNSSEYFTSLKNEIKQLIELYGTLIKKKNDSDSVELRKGSITAEVNQVKVMTEAQKELLSVARELNSVRKTGRGLGLELPNVSKELSNLRSLYGILTSLIKKGTYDEGVMTQLREQLNLIRQIISAQKEANNAKTAASTASTNQGTEATRRNTTAKTQNATATQKLSIEEEQLAKSIQKGIAAYNHQSTVINDLKSMAQQYLGVWGAQQFLHNIIEIGGQLEMQRLSIAAILGDAAHANDLFERIKSLAVQSPFGVVELDQMSKQLTAYGFHYNELYDMTKRLADISAATGTDVSRLSLALGHVRSEAALSGYTLRQFSMANIPLAAKLAENLSKVEKKFVSVADVRKRVTKKEIGYEEVEKVIKDLTNEGGMFYQAQEIMSQSVKARFKNLKDAMSIMYGEIAESFVGDTLKDVAQILTRLTRRWEELFTIIGTGLVVFGATKAYMLLFNKLMGQNAVNVLAGINSTRAAEAANIRLAASYRNITLAENAMIATSKKWTLTERIRGVKNLTDAEKYRLVTTRQQIIAGEALALSTQKQTVEDLARQVALGQLSKAQARQAIIASTLTDVQKKSGIAAINSVRTYGRMTGIINGTSMAITRFGMALKSLLFNPQMAIFALLAGIMELWQKNRVEVERAKKMNDDLFNRATEGIKNIQQMMSETDMKFIVNGKETAFGDVKDLGRGKMSFTPSASMDTASMIAAIDKWSNFIKDYAANKNAILNASFKDEEGNVRSLAEQYDYLGNAVGEVAEAYVRLKELSGAMQYSEDLTNKGIFDDSLTTNINDYSNAVKTYNDSVSEIVQNHRQSISSALQAARAEKTFAAAVSAANATMQAEKGRGLTDVEQLKMLIENQEKYNDAVKEFEKVRKSLNDSESDALRTVFHGSGAGWLGADGPDKYAAQVRSAYETMDKDADTWVSGMKQKMSELGWDVNKLTKDQKEALALAIAELVAKSEDATDDVRKSVEKLMKQKFGITIDDNTLDVVERVVGMKKSLEEIVGHDWHIDIKTATDFDDVISKIRKDYKAAQDYFANVKPLMIKMGIDVSGGMKELGVVKRNAIISQWKKENPGKDATMFETMLSDWDSYAQKMNDAMDFNKQTNISLTDPTKNKNNKGQSEDKDAKRLREIARLYKDAYDWYNKYEKQVGKGSALEKVQKQFQPLFDEFSKQFGQTLSLDSIPEYRENLTALLDEAMKIYSDPKHQNSYMVQAIQNIRDAINNVDYEEAQRKMDEYASSVQVKLDILSRAWDTFNTVRKATGNIGLAINIAGVEYQEGQHNIADALRKMVEDDFASLGVTAIPFSVTIDEKKLENDIKAAFETAKPKQMKGESDKEYSIRLSEYFSHIKGIVSEYKKWQDLQKEVEKGDVDTFSKLLSSAVDLKTQVAQIKDEYQEMIESLERLKRDGRIDRKDYHRSSSIASANMQMKLVQATNTYQLLIDGVVTINKKAAQSIRRDYINALEQQLKAGAITAKEYADKISDINDKMKKLEDNPSYLTSYMQGGLNGVFDNIMKRGHSMSESGASIMQNAQSMIDDSFSNGDFKQFTEGIKKMNSGKEMAQIGQGMEQMGGEMMQTVAIIDMIVHGINDLVQGFKDTYDEIREMHEALGDNTKSDSWEDWNTFFSSFSAASNSATKGWDSLKNGDVGGVISGVVGSWTNWITGFAKGHDQKNQNMIDRIGENIRALEMNTEAIKGARERTLGYDMGEINRRLSEYYMPNNRVNPHVTDHAFDGLKTSHIEHILFSLSYDMAQYYGNKSSDTGYKQELDNLKKQRDEVAKQYAAEKDKKNESQEAIDNYKTQIAELDEKILNFAQDLAKELWGIDIKGWADQISDAIWTAFENGEDAVKAFGDTAKQIISDVAKKMMNLHLIEPVMQALEFELFGGVDSNGNVVKGKAYNEETGEWNEEETLRILGRFFGEDGEFAKVVDSAEQFYKMAERVTGVDFSSDGNTSMSGGIKGVTEQTADLIASYLNAIRADVSVNRAMIAQYFPLFLEAVTANSKGLTNIEQNVDAIMKSNQIIADKISDLDSRVEGLQTKKWKLL